jgi:hypothetical protein
VRLPGLVGEDHLAGRGVLGLAAERQVVLVAGRVPHLERPGDLVRVEDGDRDGEGQRDRVAQVDQRVQPRQAALLAEPAQQRLGRAAVLGRLQAHPGEGAPPRPGSREILIPVLRPAGPWPARVVVRAGGRVGGDALGVQDAGDQGREVPPERGVVLEVHHVLPS